MNPREIDLAEYVRQRADRAAVAGVSDADVADARNSGQRRTPEKRAMLDRVRERAKQAGVQPLPGNW